MNEPELAPPGAGIPFYQKMVLKTITKPFVAKRSDWDKNWDIFHNYNAKIINLAESSDEKHKKVLVPKIKGLEDSSRFWSHTMVIEHLSIVGEGIRDLILALSTGTVPHRPISTANVKPSEDSQYASVKKRYDAFCDTVQDDLSPVRDIYLSDISIRKLKKDHPWFGAMTIKEWQWLLCMHVGIHLKQTRLIAQNIQNNE